MGFFSSWQAILMAVLLGFGGTIMWQNHIKDKKIEAHLVTIAEQSQQIQTKENENVRLNVAIADQNASIEALGQRKDELQGKVTSQAKIIDDLQMTTDIELTELDGEIIEKTPGAAIEWLLKKALESK